MIYFASPLFNEFERDRNIWIVARLEAFDSVFLPQRDGSLLVDLVKSGASVIDAEAVVFQRDIEALNRANLLIANLDGAVVDEGVAFEVGVAFALGVYCVGLQTDARRQLPTGNNPMISQSLSVIFQREVELFGWVEEHYREQGLNTISSNREQKVVVGK